MSRNKTSQEKLNDFTDWMCDINEDAANRFTTMLTPQTVSEEVDTCMRCSEPLHSNEDIVTGICAECWTPDDNDEELDKVFK